MLNLHLVPVFLSTLLHLTHSYPIPVSTPPSLPFCLTAPSALQIATTFSTLLTSYTNNTASTFLRPDFSAYSDSTLSLINAAMHPSTPSTLGSPLFTSLADFQAGQSYQNSIPVELLNVWYGCDFVTVRWRSSRPVDGGEGREKVQQVTGIVVLQVVQGFAENGEERWTIKTLWQEFNSLAWAVDAGFVSPNCSSVRRRMRRRR